MVHTTASRPATLPPPPREWTVRENRWLAGRYGIDAELIVEDIGAATPVPAAVRELVSERSSTS